MRHFSFKPSMTFRNRQLKGLRGFAGKPFHPPLTDIPVGAYILAPAFDVISRAGYLHVWSLDFFRAATFVYLVGGAVSLLTALTGFMDWRNTKAGTQARRTVNAHAITMIIMTILVIINIVWRLSIYHTTSFTPTNLMLLSVVIAGLVTFGSTIGGSLTYEYGFNVESATDSPVWHKSEDDIFHGQHKKA